jgi:hypothetical protein
MRRLWRERWMLMLAGPALAVAALYAWLGRAWAEPRLDGPTFYPAVMLYQYTAAPLATAVVLLAMVVLALWAPQALRRAPRFQLNGLAVLLALAGSGLACWGSLPGQLVHYRHVDRAEAAGRVHQLGVRLGLDGNNHFVACDCAPPGLVCQCRSLVEAGPLPELTERPALAVQPDGTLAIMVGETTVYSWVP